MDPTKWQAPFAVVAMALFVIVMARSHATYWLGRGIVAGSRHTRLARLLNSPAYQRGETWVQRWGAPAVAVCYLTIGLQTMVMIAAGVARMPMRVFVPASVVGSIAWALVYATVGFMSVEAILRLWALNPLATLCGLVAVAVGIVALVVRGRRSRGIAETADVDG